MAGRGYLVCLSLCMLVGFSTPVAAEPAPDGAEYSIYLVTMYPGEELFTGFGHIAFRVVNHETGDDDVYDYGTYEYDDPLLGWKFLVGSLQYFCSHTTFKAMVDWYSGDFGGILVQELNLTPGQKAKLVAQVAHDCLPENAAYSYHHFYNNCATKLRDILDGLLGGELGQLTKTTYSERSLRDLIDASLNKWQFAFSRWVVFGLLNHTIDVPASRWEQMFLPWYLSHEVDSLVQPDLPGRPPLVVSREIVVGAEKGPPPTPSVWAGVVFLALLLLFFLAPLVFVRRFPNFARSLCGGLTALAGLAGGFYGTVLFFSWAVSPYPETKYNFSTLIFHPGHFLLLWWGVSLLRGTNRWARPASGYLAVGFCISLIVTVLSLTAAVPQRIWHYSMATSVTCSGLWWSMRRTA